MSVCRGRGAIACLALVALVSCSERRAMAPDASAAIEELDAQSPAPLRKKSAAYDRYQGDAEAQKLLRLEDQGKDATSRAGEALQEAIAVYTQALSGWEARGDDFGQARCLEGIANALDLQGHPQESLELRQRAITHYAKLDLPRFESRSVGGIGRVLTDLGRIDEAKASYRVAIAKAEAGEDMPFAAMLRHNLADLLALQGQLHEAYRITEESRRLFADGGERYAKFVAIEEMQLGSLASELGRWEQARDHLLRAEAALDTLRLRWDHGRALLQLAELYLERPELATAAADLLANAQRVAADAGDARARAYATMLLAGVYARQERWDDAEAVYREALAMWEELVDVPGSLPAHIGRGDVLIALGRFDEADEELRRAVALATSLGARDLQSRALAVQGELAMARQLPREALGLATRAIEIAESIRDELGVESEELLHRKSIFGSIHPIYELAIRARVALGGDDAARDAFVLSERAKEQTLREVLARDGGDLARLDEYLPQALQEWLDDDAELIRYFVGQRQSYLFRLRRDELQMLVLPNAAQLGAMVREFSDELQARNRSELDAEALRRADAHAVALAEQLSALLLPGGSDAERLVIVADGVLTQLPFAALRTPERYWAEAYALSLLPSAALAASTSSLPTKAPFSAETRLHVLADPVFGTSDLRAGGGAASTSQLPRLRFTAFEADAIAKTFSKVRQWRGFEASREAMLQPSFWDAEVVHIATHGLADLHQAERSRLALAALDVDGHSQADSVALREIYSLPLRTRLVVLSACESGAGESIAGEGELSFASAFLLAGAEQVVASYWPIADRGSAELMARFYRQLREGGNAREALRTAQRSMLAEERWRAPYYWASFAVHGSR